MRKNRGFFSPPRFPLCGKECTRPGWEQGRNSSAFTPHLLWLSCFLGGPFRSMWALRDRWKGADSSPPLGSSFTQRSGVTSSVSRSRTYHIQSTENVSHSHSGLCSYKPLCMSDLVQWKCQIATLFVLVLFGLQSCASTGYMKAGLLEKSS